MRESKGEYRGGKGKGYARVHVSQVSEDTNGKVSVALDDDPWNAPLKAGTYPEWIEAAVYGSQYALDTARITWGNWEVRRIVGTDADTYHALVVIAAARAIWNCCDFRPAQAAEDRLIEHANAFRFSGAPHHLTEGT